MRRSSEWAIRMWRRRGQAFRTLSSHNRTVVAQFSQQAVPFSEAAPITDEAAVKLVLDHADVGPADVGLDVACGPGILTCAFARRATSVTGIDLTPAMLERARQLAASQGLSNCQWDEGDVTALPYGDSTFSVVMARLCFHHFLEPMRVLLEMKRVCKVGGRILVVDTTPEKSKADAFNAMELLRDNSHVRALPLEEHLHLISAAGLTAPRVTTYRLVSDVDSLLARSFPLPGNAPKVRDLFVKSCSDGDSLGIDARMDNDGRVHYGFPVSAIVAHRSI